MVIKYIVVILMFTAAIIDNTSLYMQVKEYLEKLWDAMPINKIKGE